MFINGQWQASEAGKTHLTAVELRSWVGGGASAFKDWTEVLPADIELCIVQMPSREKRLREPLLNDMTELVDVLSK